MLSNSMGTMKVMLVASRLRKRMRRIDNVCIGDFVHSGVSRGDYRIWGKDLDMIGMKVGFALRPAEGMNMAY